MKMRRRNVICWLEDEDDAWSTDRQRIKDVAIQYFCTLFTTTAITGFQDIIDCVPCRVESLDNIALTAKVIDIEIENALHQMHPTKSPGPDGFNAWFSNIIGRQWVVWFYVWLNPSFNLVGC